MPLRGWDAANSAAPLVLDVIRMMIKRILTSLSILLVFGCSDILEPANTVPVKAGHEEIATALVKELTNNGDWYRVIDKTTIEIKNPPPSYVISLLEEETQKILPTGRSSSIGGEFRGQVYDRLSEKGIKYVLIEFDSDEWIVWNENDSKAVEDIIDSVTNEVLEEKYSQ